MTGTLVVQQLLHACIHPQLRRPQTLLSDYDAPPADIFTTLLHFLFYFFRFVPPGILFFKPPSTSEANLGGAVELLLVPSRYGNDCVHCAQRLRTAASGSGSYGPLDNPPPLPLSSCTASTTNKKLPCTLNFLFH
jgi:hypothetical protein